MNVITGHISNTTKTIHWANSVHTHWAAGIRKNIHSLTLAFSIIVQHLLPHLIPNWF